MTCSSPSTYDAEAEETEKADAEEKDENENGNEAKGGLGDGVAIPSHSPPPPLHPPLKKGEMLRRGRREGPSSHASASSPSFLLPLSYILRESWDITFTCK